MKLVIHKQSNMKIEVGKQYHKIVVGIRVLFMLRIWKQKDAFGKCSLAEKDLFIKIGS